MTQFHAINVLQAISSLIKYVARVTLHVKHAQIVPYSAHRAVRVTSNIHQLVRVSTSAQPG